MKRAFTHAVLPLAVACLLCSSAGHAAVPVGESTLDNREIRAQLTPRRYTTLSAEIGAKITHLPLAEGASFKQGQTLVQFDCLLQQAQLAKAQATLMAADASWQGNQKLAALNSVGKVELSISKAETLKAQAEVSGSRTLLSKCQITAPFAGRIAEQKVREEQFVQPGQALLEILDDSTLELEFIVPSRWLVWLRKDTAFQVSIDETGKTYPAKVQRIGARVDAVTQSIKLSAVVDGRFDELMAGMSGNVVMTPPAPQ